MATLLAYTAHVRSHRRFNSCVQVALASYARFHARFRDSPRRRATGRYNAALQCVMGASGGIIGGRITDVMGRENAAGMLHTPAILQLSGAAGLGGSIFSGAFLASFGW